MQLEGKVKLIKDTQEISDKFKKREFVLTVTDGNYDQDILLELTQDKCALLDGVNEGDQLTASINIRGREWTSPKTGEIKYFNTIQAWKLDINASAPAPVPASADAEDLPF